MKRTAIVTFQQDCDNISTGIPQETILKFTKPKGKGTKVPQESDTLASLRMFNEQTQDARTDNSLRQSQDNFDKTKSD